MCLSDYTLQETAFKRILAYSFEGNTYQLANLLALWTFLTILHLRGNNDHLKEEKALVKVFFDSFQFYIKYKKFKNCMLYYYFLNKKYILKTAINFPLTVCHAWRNCVSESLLATLYINNFIPLIQYQNLFH